MNKFISLMGSRLWYMNADFETELACPVGTYRRLPSFEALNHRLAPQLLWLARPGDAMLLAEPWSEHLRGEAGRRRVELISPARPANRTTHIFTPWGWTPSAVDAGEQTGAVMHPLPFSTVARVNSKLWSHALEVELGWAQPGATAADTFAELQQAVARACPRINDKWVIKSPFGFAARDRVLGRGPVLEGPQATWSKRR